MNIYENEKRFGSSISLQLGARALVQGRGAGGGTIRVPEPWGPLLQGHAATYPFTFLDIFMSKYLFSYILI